MKLGAYGYLFTYYLDSLRGRKKPLLGSLKLTHDCNLACVQCPFRKRKSPSLSFLQARGAMQALHDRGVRILIVEGGEPFLWRDGEVDVRHVVSEAKKLFFSVGVTTNGTFPIEVDSDNVWVSIDGLQETHDRLRGKSFQRIMAHLATTTHPRVHAHITINTRNVREIPELVRYLAHRVKGITIQLHYPFEEVDPGLLLPLDRRRQVLDDLIALKRQGLPLANSYAALRALKDNDWTCQPWMIASVDPNGSLTQGCYVQNRGEIACEQCGFSAHTEISLAYGGRLGPIWTGRKLFFPAGKRRN